MIRQLNSTQSMFERESISDEVDLDIPSDLDQVMDEPLYLLNIETHFPVAELIEYLIHHQTDRFSLQEFENLIKKTLNECNDHDLLKMLRSLGWMGNKFRVTNAEETPIDFDYIEKSLSNLYLKQQSGYFHNQVKQLTNQFDSTETEEILSFCPDAVLTYFRKARPNLLDDSKSHTISLWGACMIADISGFSKYSGSMCKKGVKGLDELREATNGFLGYFVKVIYEYGGDVIAFAGDALISIFVQEESIEEIPSPSDCCYRALQCASGVNNQFVYLLNGSCVSELASCIHDANKHEVVATQACYNHAIVYCDYIGSSKRFTSVTGEKATTNPENKNMKVTKVGNTIRSIRKLRTSLKHVSTTSLSISGSNVLTRKTIDSLRKNDQLLKYLVEASIPFVPIPCLKAISAGSFNQMSELRTVTTMFISFDSYSPLIHIEPQLLQPFFLITQTEIFQLGGFLRQFLVDDKGCVLIAMWGIPSFSFANNSQRALQCASIIRARCLESSNQVSIGITTGMVYCCSLGSPERRDYVGIGSDVNMAARLMSKANGSILIDQNSFDLLPDYLSKLLVKMEPLNLKGSETPVVSYMYSRNLSIGDFMTSEQNSSLLTRQNALQVGSSYQYIILRPKLKELLSGLLDKLSMHSSFSLKGMTVQEVQANGVHFGFIFGLPGSGKSIAAKYFEESAKLREITCLTIHAKASFNIAPYGLINELLFELIGKKNFESQHEKEHIVHQLIETTCPNHSQEDKEIFRAALAFRLGFDLNALNVLGSMFMNESLSKDPSDFAQKMLESYEDLENVFVNSKDMVCDFDGVLVVNELSYSTISSNPRNEARHEDGGVQTMPTMEASSPQSIGKTDDMTVNNRQKVVFKDDEKALSDDSSVSEADGIIIPVAGGIGNFDELPNNSEGSNSNRRQIDDQYVLTDVLAELLAHNPMALIIKNSQFIDELSWNEIHALLRSDRTLQLSILFTMTTTEDLSKIISGMQKSYIIGEDSMNGNQGSLTSNSDQRNEILKGKNHTNHVSIRNRISESRDDRYSTSRAVSLDLESLEILERIRNSSHHSTLHRLLNQTYYLNHLHSSFLTLVNLSNSTVIKLCNLSEDEICSLFKFRFRAPSILPPAVLDIIIAMTSGNAFWCRSLAEHWKEQGIKDLQEIIRTNKSDGSISLQSLVLGKLENLGTEMELILRYASVIGDEIHDEMLMAILPKKHNRDLDAILESLVGIGFLYCVQDSLYVFQNHYIQKFIYETIPHGDAVGIHISIAEYIDQKFAKNLRPFYPILAYHYGHSSVDKRPLAFKFHVKSADQAIQRGAFVDGFTCIKAAYELSKKDSITESNVILQVIKQAMVDMGVEFEASKSLSGIMRKSFIKLLSSEKLNRDYKDLSNEYAALGIIVIKNIKLIEKRSEINTIPRSVLSNKTALQRKNDAPLNRNVTMALNWQPSYTARTSESTTSNANDFPDMITMQSKKDFEDDVQGCRCILN